MLTHRECLLGCQTLQHRLAVPGLRLGSSLASQPRNPLHWRHQYGLGSLRWSPLNPGGVSHHPKASCWARGSLNAAACHWACRRALESPRLSLIRWVPINTLPLGFSSFHEWGWMIFSISMWIHLWGWLTVMPWGNVWVSPRSSAMSNLFFRFLLSQYGGVMLLHPAPGFIGFCLHVQVFYRVAELLICRKVSMEARGG